MFCADDLLAQCIRELRIAFWCAVLAGFCLGVIAGTLLMYVLMLAQ